MPRFLIQHSPECPREQAWDLGEATPCLCSKGYPRRVRASATLTPSPKTFGEAISAMGFNDAVKLLKP